MLSSNKEYTRRNYYVHDSTQLYDHTQHPHSHTPTPIPPMYSYYCIDLLLVFFNCNLISNLV